MLRGLLLCVLSMDLTDRPGVEWVGPALENTFLILEVGNLIISSLTSNTTTQEVLLNADKIVQSVLEQYSGQDKSMCCARFCPLHTRFEVVKFLSLLSSFFICLYMAKV